MSGSSVDAQALAGGGGDDAALEAGLDGPDRFWARGLERGDPVGNVAPDGLGQLPQHGQSTIGRQLGEHEGDGLRVLVGQDGGGDRGVQGGERPEMGPDGCPADPGHDGLGFGRAPQGLGQQVPGHLGTALGGAGLALGLGDEVFHDLVDEGLVHRAEIGDLGHDLFDFVVVQGLDDAGSPLLAQRDEQERGLAGTAHPVGGVSHQRSPGPVSSQVRSISAIRSGSRSIIWPIWLTSACRGPTPAARSSAGPRRRQRQRHLLAVAVTFAALELEGLEARGQGQGHPGRLGDPAHGEHEQADAPPAARARLAPRSSWPPWLLALAAAFSWAAWNLAARLVEGDESDLDAVAPGGLQPGRGRHQLL